MGKNSFSILFERGTTRERHPATLKAIMKRIRFAQNIGIPAAYDDLYEIWNHKEHKEAQSIFT